jgi:hypothetical protein
MGRKVGDENCGPDGVTNTLEKDDGKAQISTNRGIQITMELVSFNLGCKERK